MLADFHNVGMTLDFNAELNKSAKGVDSSSAMYFSSILSYLRMHNNYFIN